MGLAMSNLFCVPVGVANYALELLVAVGTTCRWRLISRMSAAGAPSPADQQEAALGWHCSCWSIMEGRERGLKGEWLRKRFRRDAADEAWCECESPPGTPLRRLRCLKLRVSLPTAGNCLSSASLARRWPAVPSRCRLLSGNCVISRKHVAPAISCTDGLHCRLPATPRPWPLAIFICTATVSS